MRWWTGCCALVIAAQVARADSSVAQPASAEPGWCLALFLKETKRAAPAAAPAESARPASFTLGAVTVQLELPASFSAALVGRDVLQAGPGAPTDSDAFAGWDATLQVRWQTRGQLKARVNAIPSDFTGTTRATIETRAARFQGKSAEELCAIVHRTAGHATTVDGRHHPMPDIVELVHGYLFPIGEQTLGAVYRLSPEAVEQQPSWERMLDSIRVAESGAIEMIVVFNKGVTGARCEQVLKELGWSFHAGSDSSRGKKYFYDHGPQLTVRVPGAELERFRGRAKQYSEIFETYQADRSIQKD
jgi:hypothetical protein